jgi:hypothetical protein
MRIYTNNNLGTGRNSHSTILLMLILISTPSSQTFSRSIKPGFGCRQSILPRLQVHHLASKHLVVLDQVLSALVVQPKVVHSLPSKRLIAYHKQGEAIKMYLRSRSLQPQTDQCLLQPFNLLVTPMATHLSTLPHVTRQWPQVPSGWNSLQDSPPQLHKTIKGCQLAFPRRMVPMRFMMSMSLVEMPLHFPRATAG